MFLLSSTSLGNSSFAVLIFNDYTQAKSVFSIIAPLTVTEEALGT